MADCIKLADQVRVLNVAFDVSQDSLAWYAELNGRAESGEIKNRTRTIEKSLGKLRKLAGREGYDELRLICESTGVYHRSLLQIGSRMGMRTALASGEAVSKLRVVESNDPGKTDAKDTRAILTVALVGRLLIHRQLDEKYACLRSWHGLVLVAEDKQKGAKTELHHELKSLIPDLSLKPAVLYGPTGRALVEQYGGDPYEIVGAGRAGFWAAMRGAAKGVKGKTLAHIWEAAEATVRQQRPRSVCRIEACRVRQLYEEVWLHAGRKAAAAEEMKRLYGELRKIDPHLPAPRKGVVSELNAARLVAETGPLNDFCELRQLMRYGGLNLRERQSGRWRGQTKVSRRGRAALRKVLGIIVFPLVKKKSLYGRYYHGKKDRDKMPGTKAMVCVMRKFLKMFFGWYHSKASFHEERVFLCESAYARQVAA